MAIASKSKLFINTDCFHQVLNRIWYNKLSRTKKSFFWYLRCAIAFLSLGLLAPVIIPYSPAEDAHTEEQLVDLRNNYDKVSIF